MPEGSYELVRTDDGRYTARISARGVSVLGSPMINRGTAFTEAERRELGLTGLLPSGVSTLDGQLRRTYAQFRRAADDLAKWVYLTNLRNRNEVLFYKLLSEHIEEMLPIVYTPTVGLAIEQFSNEFRRPRGVYLSVDHPEEVETALRNTGLGAEDVDLLVATDSEGILGIGDQGVGGIEISVGKLAVYTAAAGIHPNRVLPVVLDVGTDNLTLLNDEMYLGERHARVRDERYDQLIDAYVTACQKLFPNAMLHWEDFGASNARRILDRYADAGVHVQRRHAGHRRGRARRRLLRRPRGGVADARPARGHPRRRHGRAGDRGHDARPDGPRGPLARGGDAAVLAAGPARDPRRRPARAPAATSRSRTPARGTRSRAGVLRGRGRAWPTSCGTCSPTMLIGTSTQSGAFTEQIVRDMAAHTDRPIIMPLSNPTSKAEAMPADVLAWTGGRALVATGSPFAPVELDGVTYRIAQANNALVFPGLGLGVTVARASRISDGMIAAAADAVARLSDAGRPGAPLLPPVSDLRPVSAAVAIAVAEAAVAEGLAQAELGNAIQQVHEAMWRPDYPRVEAKPL